MITFTVPGEPQTKGSFRSFRDPRTGKQRVVNDNPRTKAWQDAITTVARFAMRGRPPLRTAVIVEAHFRCKWEGKGEPSGVPAVDGDKLLRALFDGLTGVAIVDDANVIGGEWSKAWGEPGVTVKVTEATP